MPWAPPISQRRLARRQAIKERRKSAELAQLVEQVAKKMLETPPENMDAKEWAAALKVLFQDGPEFPEGSVLGLERQIDALTEEQLQKLSEHLDRILSEDGKE